MVNRFFNILLLLVATLCIHVSVRAQSNAPVYKTIDSLPSSLNTLWKFNTNDSIQFASPAYNDTLWKKQYSKLQHELLDSIGFKGFAWLRLKIRLPYPADSVIYALQIMQVGASEIYVDGKKVAGFGTVSVSGKDEERFDPKDIVQPVIFKEGSEHLIAIRYSNHKYDEFSKWDEFEAGFSCRLMKYGGQNLDAFTEQAAVALFLLTIAGIFLALAMIHFLFFVFYRKQKQHLYYGILAFFFSLFFIGGFTGTYTFIPDIYLPIRFFTPIALPFYFISLMGFVYYLVLERLPKLFWLQVFIGVLIIIGFFYKTGINIVFHIALILFVTIEAIRVLYKGIKLKKKGIKIIAGGFALFFALCILMILAFFVALAVGGDIDITFGNSITAVLLLLLTVMSIPISISVYLARNFATLNIDLEKKLVEVEQLSEQMLQQEKEKKKILEDQNILLEQQVAERTLELSQKNKDITDSINYAKRIQRALLAGDEMLSVHFKDYFIFFQPKDIVSGDFYWAAVLENGQIALVTADSTGHGVPGAIMSMLNISCLSDAAEAQKLTDPGAILNYTRKRIIRQLANDGSAEGGKDGMDCSLICFDIAGKKMSYAAANNPVWIVRNSELIELKGDKMPVGKHDRQDESFTQHTVDLQKGDMIYTLTDGFPDQFGGPKGKKFMYKQLKELLISISALPVQQQKEKLNETFAAWKSGYEQVDDVCIIGIRL
ncbi:MAG: protein serine/threonine phosphatase [Bacteroidetes bacterium]|nr:protein serine/threonine phosphatase [Bacteroidota bacterium]